MRLGILPTKEDQEFLIKKSGYSQDFRILGIMVGFDRLKVKVLFLKNLCPDLERRMEKETCMLLEFLRISPSISHTRINYRNYEIIGAYALKRRGRTHGINITNA